MKRGGIRLYYHNVDLLKSFNNIGLTETIPEKYLEGELTLGNSSIPCDKLDFRNLHFYKKVPFLISKNKNYQDNIELQGQTLTINKKKVKRVHFLSCSCYGDYQFSIYINGVVEKTTTTKDFVYYDGTNFNDNKEIYCWHKFPHMNTQNGKNTVHDTAIWYTYICLENPIDIEKIVFDDIPLVHIFSITLEGE